MPATRRRNPFYILLVPVGILFVVTAFAYGVMAFQAVRTLSGSSRAIDSHRLIQWLQTHGAAAMLWELAVLAVLTIAAIALDGRWSAARPSDGGRE